MIIGLSGKLGSGKTFAAKSINEILVQDNKSCTTLNFAFALKKLATDFFGWDGKKDEKGRKLLQVIGTECGRMYDQDFWVKKLDLETKKYAADVIHVIDDVRFPNEFNYVKESGGLMIRLVSIVPVDMSLLANNHPSELALDKWEQAEAFDALIVNRFDETLKPLLEMTLRIKGVIK